MCISLRFKHQSIKESNSEQTQLKS